MIGIIGCGVTGRRVGRLLARQIDGEDTAPLRLLDVSAPVAERLAREVHGERVGDITQLAGVDAVVLSCPPPHLTLATRLISDGIAVVSMSDDPDDVRGLLGLHRLAVACDTWLIAGVAMSPGLSGLVAHRLAEQLPLVDEIHVATHGTAGPACARQHHRALGSTAEAWHDGEWVQRPGGSGRELCWFPGEVGAHDCYRHATADPMVLHEAFPLVARVSARTSATRRDRMTARLPMLSPPHRDGDNGAVRVEVRGADASGGRVTLVVGAAGEVADLAAATAAAVTRVAIQPAHRPAAGVHVLGSELLANDVMFEMCCALGVRVHEFVGVSG